MLKLMTLLIFTFLSACGTKQQKSSVSISESAPIKLARQPAAAKANDIETFVLKESFSITFFTPRDCSQAKALQQELVSEFQLVTSIYSSSPDKAHTCKDAIQHLNFIKKIATETELTKRVRPSAYLEIVIHTEDAFDKLLNLSFGKLRMKMVSEEGKKFFFSEVKYTTGPSILPLLKDAFASLPYKDTPAGDDFMISNAIYLFAYCGTLEETQYITQKRFLPHCPHKQGLVGRTVGPVKAKSDFHVITDFISQDVLPPNDRIFLHKISRVPSFVDGIYNASPKLNLVGQEYYNNTLSCAAKYLGGRLEWSLGDYERSGCFITPLSR